jgi:hypothetical protein
MVPLYKLWLQPLQDGFGRPRCVCAWALREPKVRWWLCADVL